MPHRIFLCWRVWVRVNPGKRPLFVRHLVNCRTFPSYHQNFNKRLIKAPKLYFFDTGLACLILGTQSPERCKETLRGLHCLKR
ncbi:MAG: DUF4143 domain-containing protein [Candidatus Kapabacteria bacterium]|nr:DUF4143 domain-containing protein [Candidatus Kapabacteria bacterium]